MMSDLNDPRVLFAAERTLLAWNRTSLSLIAFGFIVERAGILFKAMAPSLINPAQQIMTFWLGLAFIVLGAVACLYSARQYRQVLRNLTPAEFPPGYNAKWGLAANVAVGLLGLLLGVAVSIGRG